ncbi:Rhodanese-like domain containing protein [Histomonas meleagridis]|uniref:Rhodanese-like domain containing protein n=1 Tax=Histomonas meleagridis TaxID=135588 RepID=UPI0035594F72|nr:Rhodanese-like domain containing protein [Histomonas meleagridis]KAH0797129.1 Rhodanese-like domain containing protein [Histomonas meleagridis]
MLTAQRSQSTITCIPSLFPLPDLEDFDDSPMAPSKEIASSPDPKKMLVLPILPRNSTIPRVSPSVVADVLSHKYDKFFDYIYIVDCRYEYEYIGGHIKNAIHNKSLGDLKMLFFEKPLKKCLIIFHCEFSKNRGKSVAEIFRNTDRNINRDVHPFLFYPDVYILEGGYNKFYKKYPHLCDGGYVKMHDKKYKENGELGHSTSSFRAQVNEKFLRIPLEEKAKNRSASLCNSPRPCKTRKFVLSPMAKNF